MAYYTEIADLKTDKPALIELWKRNFNSADEARFNWLLNQDQEIKSGCILLKTTSGSLVGMNGFIVRKLRMNNKFTMIAQAIDLLVDKQHRTVGPAIKLQKTLIRHLEDIGVSIIYGMPLPAAQPIMKRIGYKLLGTRQRWIKPLYSRDYLSDRVSKLLAPILSPFFDIALFFKNKGFLYLWSNKFTSRLESTLNQQCDELWKNNNFFTHIGERSKSYLDWYFINTNKINFHYFFLEDKKKNTLGYIAYNIEGKTANIIDFQVCKLEYLEMLFVIFSKRMKKTNARSLSLFYLGKDSIGLILDKCGFFNRPEKSQIFLYLCNSAATNVEGIYDYKHWFFTDVDKDI